MPAYMNGFSDLEHTSAQPEKAKAFYQKLFGWKMKDEPIPGYGTRTEISTDDGPGGSIMPGREGEPARWMVYIDVKDLGATLEKAEQLGGKVVQGATHIPHAGTLAVVVDPTGAAFKLWQPE